jgi:hypothetical protein
MQTIALYDQIQMLRAELSRTYCAAEQRQIAEELAATEAAHAEETAAFELWIGSA